MKQTPLCLIPFALLALAGCRADNGFKDGLANSALLLPHAKYLRVNTDPATRYGGAINPQLRSSQAFDTGYWGWSTAQATFPNDPTTLTFLEGWDQPLPTNSFEEYYLVSFADGTWPRNYSHTGVLRPKEVTSISYKDYTPANVDVTSTTPDTYEVSYDSQTGLISTAVETAYTAAGAINTKKIWTFASDPRDYSDYYQASYAVYTGDALTAAGSQAKTISVSTSGNNQFETHTYRNYDATGSLGDFSYDSLGTKNGSTVVKWERQVGQYADATTDISADSIVTTDTYYSDETTAVYKSVRKAHYESLYTRVPISITTNEYNVSGTTETLAAKSATLYEDGFVATEQSYSVASGTAVLSGTVVYTRNDRGQPETVEWKNASDAVYQRVYYTYDSSHREATKRVHSVDTAGTETCTSGAYDKEYQTTTNTAGETIYVVTQLDYGCSGTSLATTPSLRTVTTYDQYFMPLEVQTYSYASGAYTLASQVGYSYNDDHQKSRTQYYTVSLGVATASTHIDYAYDSNGFLIDAVEKSANGTPLANYRAYTYTYR